MCPFFNFNFFIVPKGNSRTFVYLGFQKNTLLGFNFSLNITTFLFLSKITMSKGNFIKKVCIPNRVLKNKAEDLLKTIAPRVFSLIPFKFINCISTERLSVAFVSTNLLYITGCKYQKEV